jgi:hypothetical protein
LSGEGLTRRAVLAGLPLSFTVSPSDPYRAPKLRQIALPEFPGRHAVWGATGQDRVGRVWVGVSADGGEQSARLFRYDADSKRITAMGDVLGALRKLGTRPYGESQIKIHTRITEAADGWLYFASTDEEGEAEDGSAPPRWGSHLWRIRPEGGAWEHLAEVPEGLTCATAAGRTVWALGLWGHVLYRWDTQLRRLGRVEVGAVPGHMSRNIIADDRGHVFVPRVTLEGDSLVADLVEFEPNIMREVARTRLDRYSEAKNPGEAHGITGVLTMVDRSMIIATSMGYLYRIIPGNIPGAPSTVRPLGFLHPEGIAYVPSLFTWDGRRYLLGLARRHKPDWMDETWDWIVHDLTTATSRAQPFPHGITPVPLLYGSQTRDADGRFYLGGRRRAGDDRLPVLLQVETG